MITTQDEGLSAHFTLPYPQRMLLHALQGELSLLKLRVAELEEITDRQQDGLVDRIRALFKSKV